MTSFQDAHKVANELAEVLITTAMVQTTTLQSATPNTYTFIPQKLVAGRNYRVLEVGYTIVFAGTNVAVLDAFDVGTAVVPNSLIDAATVPVPGAIGDSISTSRGGANALSFVAAGTGDVDADGYPRVTCGSILQVTGITNVANGPRVVFYMRLAPEIVRDFDN
jgi:hypothetical protein